VSVGLAVFGAGRMGAAHVRNAASRIPGAHLVGVGDVDRQTAQRLIDEVGVGRADDVDGLLTDPRVEAVIIVTPTETHADLIARAADAGKHIFCEKPISSRIPATKHAAERACKAGVILQVGFQRRFDAEFEAAHHAVKSGALGELRLLRLVGRDHRMPSTAYLRTSGGQFKDQMVHEFDLARWLFSPLEVGEVYATGSALVDPAIAEFHDVDTSIAVLRFGGGPIAIIDGSREAIYGYDIRGELHGSKGLFLVGHGRLRNGELLDARQATPDVESFIERFADAYRDEIIDFVDAIRDHRQPRVGADDALEALRIAIAADRSRELHRPVALAEVRDD
jgi:myo-inositol 2-dehydrogenase/D-chiro-inositol 1-dehydrogenase